MSRSPESEYEKHIDALRRRVKYLAKKQPKNSYDKAEQAALDWVLYHTTHTREDIARAIDNVEVHQMYKKLNH